MQPVTGAPCKTCNDPRRAAIDYELAAGGSCTAIASKYGLPKHSVIRHRNGDHQKRNINAALSTLPEEVTSAIARDSANQVQALISEAFDAFPRIDAMLLKAEASDDRNNFVKLMGERRKWIELLMNVYGAFPKNGSTNIDARSVTINASLKDMSKEELLALATSGDTYDG